ncbi:MAG: hypothetical protein ACK5NT_05255, partial [Pyrinomonadaceae bacterium]
MSGIFKRYLNIANGMGNPQQGDLFGNTPIIQVESYFAKAVEEYEQQLDQSKQTSLFDQGQGRKNQPEGDGLRGQDSERISTKAEAGKRNAAQEVESEAESKKAAASVLDYTGSLSAIAEDANTEQSEVNTGTETMRSVASRLSALRKAHNPSDSAFLNAAQGFVNKFDQNPNNKNLSNKAVAKAYLNEAIDTTIDVTAETLKFSPQAIKFAEERNLDVNNPQYRKEVGKTVTEARKDVIKSAKAYFKGNTDTYTQTEAAAVVSVLLTRQIAFQPETTTEQGEILPARIINAKLTNSNQHMGSAFNGEIAAGAVSGIRDGLSPVKAYERAIETFAVNALKADNNNANTWKKFPQSSDDADIQALMKGAAGCAGGWCTAQSKGHAEEQLSNGDFYIYYDEKSAPIIAIRMYGDEVFEISGSLSNQHLTDIERDIAIEKLRSDNLQGGEAIISDAETLKVFQQFQATGEIDTRLLSYDNGVWSFETTRKHQRYGNTPLFEPSKTDIQRLNGATIAIDENTVIGGNFKVSEGDFKVKVISGNAYSAGDSTLTAETISRKADSNDDSQITAGTISGNAYSRDDSQITAGTISGDAYSIGDSKLTAGTISGNAYSRSASTLTAETISGNADSNGDSTLTAETISGYADSHGDSTLTAGTIERDAHSRDDSQITAGMISGKAYSHDASTLTADTISGNAASFGDSTLTAETISGDAYSDGDSTLTAGTIEGELLNNSTSPIEVNKEKTRALIQEAKNQNNPSITRSVSSIEDWNSKEFDKELESINLQKDNEGEILAPNGKVSNIQNERLAKIIRHPNFKKWFGDWEGKSNLESVNNSKPTKITTRSITLLQAKRKYRSLSSVVNLSDGRSIDFVNSVEGKILGHKGRELTKRMIPQLPDIVANAKPIYFETERDPNKNTNITGFHNYLAKVRIDRIEYFVRITTQELTPSERTKVSDQLHSTFISGIEITEAGNQTVTSGIIEPATVPATDFDSKLSQFIKDTQDVSKVVDENGEPLVVYHGTGSAFDVFQKDKLGSRENKFYFTPSKDAALDYGQELIPAFLNLKDFKNDGELVNDTDAEIYDTSKEASIEFGVNNPNQIKSIFNQGSFDANEDSIMRSAADSDSRDYLVNHLPHVPTEHILPFVEGDLNESNELEISEEAAEWIRRILGGQSIDGVFLDGTNLNKIIAKTKEVYGDALAIGYTVEELSTLNEFVKNLEAMASGEATKGTGVVYVYDEVLPEERFHQASMIASGLAPIFKRVTKSAINTIYKSPLMQRALKGKFGKHYGDASKAVQVEEFVVKLITGQANKYGITSENDIKAGKELVNIWTDGYVEQNAEYLKANPDAFKAFDKVSSEYGKQIRTAQTKAESRRQNSRSDGSRIETREANLAETARENERIQRSSTRDDANADSGRNGNKSESTKERIEKEFTETKKQESETAEKQKTRQFAKTLRNAGRNVRDVVYTPETEQGWIDTAESIINKSFENLNEPFKYAIEEFRSNRISDGEKSALGIALIDNLGMMGEIDLMNEIADETVTNIGTAGSALRAAQIANKYDFSTGVRLAIKAKQRHSKDGNTELNQDEIEKLRKQLADAHNAESKLREAEYALDEIKDRNANIEKENAELTTALADSEKNLIESKEKFAKNITAKQNQIRYWKNKANGELAQRKGKSTPTSQLVEEIKEKKDALLKKIQSEFGTEAMKAIAWHGTHARDIAEQGGFKSEFINSGEGAQVYGHGLYFASNEGVADWYRETVTDKNKAAVPSQRVYELIDTDEVANTIIENVANDKERWEDEVDPNNESEWEELSENERYSAIEDAFGDSIRNAVNQRLDDLLRYSDSLAFHDLESNNEIDEIIAPILEDELKNYTGAKYKVNLKPDEDEYLLWDEPFNRQSDQVKKALNSFISANERHLNGKQLYNALVLQMDDYGSGNYTMEQIAERNGGDSARAASEYLLSLGIRGNKFLDGTSRRNGNGTYNYVIFDDRDIAIIDVMRSVATHEMTEDVYNALRDLTVLEIAANTPLAETLEKIKTLSNGELDEQTIRQIHADAVNEMRVARTPLTPEQRTNRKIQQEHKKAAKEYQGNQNVLKPSRYDLELINYAQKNNIENEAVLGAMILPRLREGEAVKNWKAQMREVYPNLSEKELGKKFVEAWNLRHAVRKVIKKQISDNHAEKIQNEREFRTAEQFKRIRASEARKAQSSLEQFYRQLGRSSKAKAADILMEIWNIGKGTAATGEISYIFRQGMIPLIIDTRNALQGVKEGVGHGLIDNAAKLDIYIQKVREHPRLNEAQLNGVRFAEIGDFNIADDHFSSKVLEKIPLYRRAEAAYTLPGDIQRLAMYDTYASIIESQNLTRHEEIKAKKYAAEIANAFTGKGDIKKVLAKNGTLNKFLNIAFFSPSLLISRFQSAWYLTGGMVTAPKGMKKQMAKNSAKLYGFFGLLALTLGMGFDPDDDDFGQINIKRGGWLEQLIGEGAQDLHFNVMSGLDLPIQAAFQMAGALFKAIAYKDSGYLQDAVGKIRKKFIMNDRGEMRFLRGKLAPTTSALVSLYMGKDFLGRKYTPWNAATSMLPISWGQVWDAALYDRIDAFKKEDITLDRGIKRLKENEVQLGNAALTMLFSFLGIGINQYPQSSSTPGIEKAQDLAAYVSKKSEEVRRVEFAFRSMLQEKALLEKEGKSTARIDREIKQWAEENKGLFKNVDERVDVLRQQGEDKNGLFTFYANEIAKSENGMDKLKRVLPFANAEEKEILNKLLAGEKVGGKPLDYTVEGLKEANGENAVKIYQELRKKGNEKSNFTLDAIMQGKQHRSRKTETTQVYENAMREAGVSFTPKTVNSSSGSLVDIVLSKKKAAYADIDAALKNKTIQKPDAVRLKQVANGTMSKAEYELSSTSNPAEVVEIFGNAMNSASEDEKKRLRRALS